LSKSNFRYVVLPEILYLKIADEAKKTKRKINAVIGIAWNFYEEKKDINN
jgi:hypothetical protein